MNEASTCIRIAIAPSRDGSPGDRVRNLPQRDRRESIRDADPAALTKKLAEAKARKVASAFGDAVVVAGDAVVMKDEKLFEKPRDIAEAVEFLGELSGSSFRFVTSLVVLRADTGRMLSTA